jgi:S1-C subfamily serine protease
MPGLRVVSIEPRSAAGRAGVKAGDELLKVNGVDVHDPETVAEIVRKHPPGLAVYIMWRSGGTEEQASVIV